MKVNIRAIPYIMASVIVVNSRIWSINIPYYIQCGVMFLWTSYLLLKLLVNTKTLYKKVIYLNITLIAAPIVIMALYALIIWSFKSNIVFRNYTRLASTCVQLFLAWGFGASGYYLFKDKAIDYIFIGGVISYLSGSVLYVIWKYGFNNLMMYMWDTLLMRDSLWEINFAMEVHDLTFAMGLFFLFYSFCDKRKNRKVKIIFSIMLIVFGFKRIEVLALIAVIIIYNLLLKWGKTIRYRATFIAICFAVGCFGFVYLIDSGVLELICNALSINSMGRLGMYTYAKNFFEFSPLYMGTGYTWFSRMWGELYNSGFRIDGHVVAAAVHSSMLTFYIENGFVLTLLWIFYSFNGKVKIYRKHFGRKVAEGYLLITVYMFILYLTDNTFHYSGTQLVYFIIPLCQYYITQCRKKVLYEPQRVDHM